MAVGAGQDAAEWDAVAVGHARSLHALLAPVDRRASGRFTADNGFNVDWPLWERDYSKCGPCRPGENCH